MYVFGDGQTISGDLTAIWATWTDMPHFPDWDPREEETRLEGPFAVGTSGYSKQVGNPGGPFTLAAIEPEREWTVDSPLPGGKLTVRHLLEPAGEGSVRVSKSYEVHGPLTLLFRLYYGPKVKRALGQTFTALEKEAAKRG